MERTDIQMVHLAISTLDKHLYCTSAVVIGDHWVGCYGHSGLQINPGWRHTQLTSSYQNHYIIMILARVHGLNLSILVTPPPASTPHIPSSSQDIPLSFPGYPTLIPRISHRRSQDIPPSFPVTFSGHPTLIPRLLPSFSSLVVQK